MKKILLSEYSDQYAPEVAALFTAAVHAIPDSYYTEAQRLAWAPRQPDNERWTKRLATTRPCLAFSDGRLAGFMELCSGGYIDCAYVHPDFQRLGVGSLLMAEVARRAKLGGAPRLYTQASKNAKTFFDHHGFETLRINSVERDGQILQNFWMHKLIPDYHLSDAQAIFEEEWNLLLSADPSRAQVEEYLSRAFIRVLKRDKTPIGICAMLPLDNTRAEIKNIAVQLAEQGKGAGRLLLDDAERVASLHGFRQLLIGTGNTSIAQQALYQRCGFRIVEVRENFFVDNYPEPIWENGMQCRDMVVLAKEIA